MLIWAFRPNKSAVAAQVLQRGRQKAPETKTDTPQTCASGSEPPGQTFSPTSLLTALTSLIEDSPVKIGVRSAASSFEKTWTILDLKRTPSLAISATLPLLGHMLPVTSMIFVHLQPTFCNRSVWPLLLGHCHMCLQEPMTLSCRHL